jgi:hypothetical protein
MVKKVAWKLPFILFVVVLNLAMVSGESISEVTVPAGYFVEVYADFSGFLMRIISA